MRFTKRQRKLTSVMNSKRAVRNHGGMTYVRLLRALHASPACSVLVVGSEDISSLVGSERR